MAEHLAARILALVGGPGNVRELTRCWSRLRFVLHDDALADVTALGEDPDVAIALRQHGQLQVALRSGLLATFDELVALVAAGRPD